MRILLIADFRSNSPGFMLNNARILAKGLGRNGHDVCRFSYRERLTRYIIDLAEKGQSNEPWVEIL